MADNPFIYEDKDGVKYNIYGERLKRRSLLSKLRVELRDNPMRTIGMGISAAALLAVGTYFAGNAALDWARKENMHPQFFTVQRSRDALQAIPKEEFDELVAFPIRENIASNLYQPGFSVSFVQKPQQPPLDEIIALIKKDGYRIQKQAANAPVRNIKYRRENKVVGDLMDYVRKLEENGINFNEMGYRLSDRERWLKYNYMSERLDIASQQNKDLFAKNLPSYYDATLTDAVNRTSTTLQIPLKDMPKALYVNMILQKARELRNENAVKLAKFMEELKKDPAYIDMTQTFTQPIKLEPQDELQKFLRKK